MPPLVCRECAVDSSERFIDDPVGPIMRSKRWSMLQPCVCVCVCVCVRVFNDPIGPMIRSGKRSIGGPSCVLFISMCGLLYLLWGTIYIYCGVLFISMCGVLFISMCGVCVSKIFIHDMLREAVHVRFVCT